MLEGDLYPVPKNPTIGDDGDYSWRHWPVESVGDLVDGCYWPKVDSFCPYGGIDELTSAGWEPEECDEPAVYVGGRWYQTSWECWDMLFRFRGGEHSGDEKLLLVEQEPDFDLWWVVLAPVPVTMRDTPDGRMVVSPEVDDDMPF